MPLIKHVDGVDIEMTPEEEAEFLATLPQPPAVAPPPSRAELMAKIEALMAQVEALGD